MRKKFVILTILMLTLSILLCSCETSKEHIDDNYDTLCDECGCQLEEEYIDLEKALEDNFPLVRKKMEQIHSQFFGFRYKVYRKEDLSENNLETFTAYYGDNFIKFFYVYTYDSYSSEKKWKLFAIEFDSAKSASEYIVHAFQRDGYGELFQYNNCVFSYYKGRSLLTQGSIEIDGCEYTQDRKILVDGLTSRKAILPNDTRKIDVYAFINSFFIEELVCNEGLQYIGSWAFTNATNLKTVKLNNNLKYIGYKAFFDTGIEYVVIPRSVETILGIAFNNCIIYCEAEEKPSDWYEKCFYEGTTVYYKGEWEYNSEGVPAPIDNN